MFFPSRTQKIKQKGELDKSEIGKMKLRCTVSHMKLEIHVTEISSQ